MGHCWYFISNRATRQCIDLIAGSPEAACGEVGWELDDCVVIAVGEIAHGDAGARAGIPPQPSPALLDPKRQHSR